MLARVSPNAALGRCAPLPPLPCFGAVNAAAAAASAPKCVRCVADGGSWSACDWRVGVAVRVTVTECSPRELGGTLRGKKQHATPNGLGLGGNRAGADRQALGQSSAPQHTHTHTQHAPTPTARHTHHSPQAHVKSRSVYIHPATATAPTTYRFRQVCQRHRIDHLLVDTFFFRSRCFLSLSHLPLHRLKSCAQKSKSSAGVEQARPDNSPAHRKDWIQHPWFAHIVPYLSILYYIISTRTTQSESDCRDQRAAPPLRSDPCVGPWRPRSKAPLAHSLPAASRAKQSKATS